LKVTSLAVVAPFTTKDGSSIRELHHTPAQSLAEATLDTGASTERHFHERSEEIYFVLQGSGTMELDGEERPVGPGDAVLIPPGAWHQIRAGGGPLRFLCACAPAYSHDDTFFA
jgi:mannose-6-phosphate isomerase-like protein (cupin superfamily)